MKTKKKRSLRIRNVTVTDCYSVGEVRDALSLFSEDAPVILKCNGKNYKVVSDDDVNDKAVLIGSR